MMLSPHRSQFNLYALHGFLGQTSDWKLFPFVTHPVTLNNEHLSLPQWGKDWNRSISRSNGKNILLGYSMGGRLAWHALLDNPSLWDAAIIVSAHPGLESASDRIARVESDRHTAERLQTQPWNTFLNEWNTLPIFGNLPLPFLRKEESFNKTQLATQLDQWSLGNQIPLLNQLSQLKLPMLYIAGSLDTKFCTIAEQFHPFCKVSCISEAAHRVPWDQPDRFTEEVNQFLKEVL